MDSRSGRSPSARWPRAAFSRTLFRTQVKVLFDRHTAPAPVAALRQRVVLPANRDKLHNLGRESRIDDPHVESRRYRCPPTLRGLRFDWRSGPAEDRLPRVVWGRGVIIAAIVAPWIAMTVGWGWGAGFAFAFFVAVTLVRMAGVIVGGPLIQQAGRAYYERQLRGRRGAP